MSGDYYIALKNIFNFFTYFSNWLIFISLIAAVLAVMRARASSAALSALTALILLCFGYLPGGELMLAPLEARFPAVDPESAPPPFGIIVLGGTLNPVHAARSGTLMEFEDGGERVPTAAVLARRFPGSRIVVTGGTGSVEADAIPEGEDMKRVLALFGVEPDRIAVGSTALSTEEQVAEALDLIGADRDRDWWVVTSAHRMPRTVAAFRRVGFDPTPFPVDFRRIEPFDPLHAFSRTSAGLAMTDVAAREWLGLLLYRIGGRSDRLLPAPRARAELVARRAAP